MNPSRNHLFATLFIASLLFGAGCVVIPVGDLLRAPPIQEQVVIEGDGFLSQDKIAIVDLEGVITGSEESGFFSARSSTVADLKEQLSYARRDPEVKAVLLRISSPGGEVTACDVLHQEVLEFRKATGIPVVAAVIDQAASGGYYVAAACDAIVVHPTAIVGSIGVILQSFDVSGLFQKIGVSANPVKSAEKKDLLSPFRSRTPEEAAILQKLVDDLHSRFVEIVAARPGGPGADGARALADGRVVSGREALALKLVDRVGYLRDAVEEASTRAKLTRAPTVVRYGRGGRSGAGLYGLAGAAESAGRGRTTISLDLEGGLGPRARFLYLWQP